MTIIPIHRDRHGASASAAVAPAPAGALPPRPAPRLPWVCTHINGVTTVQAAEGTYALADAGWLFSPVDHPDLALPVACADTLAWLDAEHAAFEQLAATHEGRHLSLVVA